jgi:hypothetical protein
MVFGLSMDFTVLLQCQELLERLGYLSSETVRVVVGLQLRTENLKVSNGRCR